MIATVIPNSEKKTHGIIPSDADFKLAPYFAVSKNFQMESRSRWYHEWDSITFSGYGCEHNATDQIRQDWLGI